MTVLYYHKEKKTLFSLLISLLIGSYEELRAVLKAAGVEAAKLAASGFVPPLSAN